MVNIIIGVDGGVSGACCVSNQTSEHPWCFLNKFIKGEYDRSVINFEEMDKQLFFPIGGTKLVPTEVLVFIESQQVRMGNSRRSVGFIWWYAGVLDTYFRMRGCKIFYVSPKQWQSNILVPWYESKELIKPKNHKEWKELSIKYVSEKLGINLILHGRKKPHDGVADAICIHEYGEKVVAGEIEHYNAWGAKQKSKRK